MREEGGVCIVSSCVCVCVCGPKSYPFFCFFLFFQNHDKDENPRDEACEINAACDHVTG